MKRLRGIKRKKSSSIQHSFLHPFFLILGLVTVIYNLYLSATSVLHGDVGFNTDLARDFLLLEDVVKNHSIPLIGPRSGGIPGIFHGPAWIYLNLPAFLLGHGNPVIVGWFWVFLTALLAGLVGFVGFRLYGKTAGVFSAVLVSAASIATTSTLFNPFGAVLVFPLYFYFLFNYLTNKKALYLIAALFCAGFLIQFQIAFGMPILILSTLLILVKIVHTKLFTHFLSFLVLLLPFSTYLVFDLRHNFLEFHAFLTYISGKSGAVDNFTPHAMLMNRLSEFMHSLTPVSEAPLLLIVLLFGYFAFLLYQGYRQRTTSFGQSVLLFFYLFLGYWIFAFAFRGVIWGYYVWPFLPATVLMLGAGYKILPKFLFLAGFGLLLLANWQQGIIYKNTMIQHYIGYDSGSWLFNLKLAQTVFAQKDPSFGYYVFSPDQFGYSPRYAMDYVAEQNPKVSVAPYQKKAITYLLVSPPGGQNGSIGGDWWVQHKVNINKKPEQTISFANGFRIQKYLLTAKEQAIPSDPNLIDSLIFR